MICLGFTTSSDHSSVALSKKDKILGQITWTRKQSQSEAVVSKIQSLLKKKDISFKKIDLIAVDKGPGSFTGVRIAVNVAKTLAYTLDKPIFYSDSLDLLAYEYSLHKRAGATFPQDAISVIDAHKFLFYFKTFRISGPGQIKSQGTPQALSLEEVSKTSFKTKQIFVIGLLSSQNKSELREFFHKNCPGTQLVFTPEKLNHPKASSLVLMACEVSLAKRLEFTQSQVTDWSHLEPSYIRDPDAVAKLSNPTVNLKK